jgi:serine/threonine protein kinase
LIARNGPLPEHLIRHYFVQLVCALDYLHNVQKVAHRDLKLENILLDAHNNIKIIDFGLSRSFLEEGNLFTTMCGSYPYVAPEIIISGRYTQAADVWSLGIVLYAMATAQFPFAASDVIELCHEIVTKPINYPTNLSGELIDLISKMLCRDCDERIRIDQIKFHSWFPNEQYNSMVHAIETVFQYGSGRIDREVIEMMELDGLNGLDFSRLYESLESGEENDMTVIYKVYLRQKQGELMNDFLKCPLKYSVQPTKSLRIIQSRLVQGRMQRCYGRDENHKSKSVSPPPIMKRIELMTKKRDRDRDRERERKRRFPVCPIWRLENTPVLVDL